jgi:hypothetical protein
LESGADRPILFGSSPKCEVEIING